MHRIALAGVVGVFGIWATCSLGFWQLRRAAAKEVLQQRIDAALRAPPTTPSADAMRTPETLVHRHLSFEGRWMPDRVVYLDNRPQNGQAGFYVLMPLRIESPIVADVIVNRGWTARNMNDRTQIGDYRTPDGLVRVSGIALPEEPRLMDLARPDDRALKGIWQNFDVDAYARLSSRTPLPLVLREDAAPSSSPDGLSRSWPDRGTTLQSQIDRHHGYAFQWFALAATLLFLLLFQVVRTYRHDRLVPS